jgi:hypothetical protein
VTVGAQGFFTDETPDSDVAQLLAPHATALITHVRSDDSRILDLDAPVPGLPTKPALMIWDGRNYMPLLMIRVWR